MRFQTRDNHVLITTSDGLVKDIQFEWPVVETVMAGDTFVVRIDPMPGTCDNENVFGISQDGCIVWQVGKRRHIYNDSPYTGLTIVDGKLVLSNWDGTDLVVDPPSGRVLSESQGK